MAYYDIRRFPPVMGRRIILPTDTLMYRGYDMTFPSISSYPGYFGMEETAKGYSSIHGRRLGAFVTTHELRLYDLRYLMTLLPILFSGRRSNEKDLIDVIMSTTLAFGLCSFHQQINLLHKRYPSLNDPIAAMERFQKDHLTKIKTMSILFNPAEPQGVRMAETTNDAEVLTFLKELLRGHVDGYIAPELISPFHEEKGGVMSAEIVIFDPIASGVVELPSVPINVSSTPITDIVIPDCNMIDFAFRNMSIRIASATGGGKPSDDNRDKFFNDVHMNKKNAVKRYKKIMRASARFKAELSEGQEGGFNTFITPPPPTLRVVPWDHYVEFKSRWES